MSTITIRSTTMASVVNGGVMIVAVVVEIVNAVNKVTTNFFNLIVKISFELFYMDNSTIL